MGCVADYLPAPSAAGAGVTFAEIVMRVCSGTVLALIVTVLVCLFFFPLELNFTSISPSSPGAMGSLGHFGTVQPQDPLQRSMMSGLSPVLVNVKMCVTASPSSMVPKSQAFSAKVMEVEGPVSAGASAASAAGSIFASGAAFSVPPFRCWLGRFLRPLLHSRLNRRRAAWGWQTLPGYVGCSCCGLSYGVKLSPPEDDRAQRAQVVPCSSVNYRLPMPKSL